MAEMYQLGFELGKDVSLSVSELGAVLATQKIEVSFRLIHRNLLIVTSENPALMTVLIDHLGGTVKIFDLVGEVKVSDQLIDFIAHQLLPNQLIDRINFGLSGYGNIRPGLLYSIGKELKKQFLAVGLKARLVTSKEPILSSVIVKENKLIERGFEAILIKENDRFLIGRTRAVQNYKLYSKRDYGRPVRDDKNGILPPKLAQIMINLAEISNKSSLYDPFCGSGTVLQEALLFGYEKVFGSDKSEKQVKDTLLNLKWFEQNFDTKKLPDENIFLSDILSPLKKLSVEAIITEGYLGEPYRRDLVKAREDANTLADFYCQSLANLVKMITSEGKIVIAIPFFVVGNDYVYLPLLDRLDGLGLVRQRPLTGGLSLALPGRGNLTYRRENQFVGREILTLSHKK